MTLERPTNDGGPMRGLSKRAGIISLIFVFVVVPSSVSQERKSGSSLQTGTTWIGKAEIPIDNSNKIFKEQAIAMRIEHVQGQSVRATLWPTRELLLRLQGELTKENSLNLRVVEVCLPKDGPLQGVMWQNNIIFQGRLSGDKIEGTIRWPANADGVAKQGTFMLRAIK